MQNVNILVKDDYDFQQALGDYVALGLQVSHVLEYVRVIAGSIAITLIPDLEKYPGTFEVEINRTVSI